MVKTFARLEGGTLADFADEVKKAGALAVTAAVTAGTETLKDAFRADITGAALGERLGKAIGSKVYPRAGVSLDAAGLVFPRGKKSERIFQAWNDGATIVPTGGRRWLAIPTPKAGHGARGSLMTPQKFRDATGIALRFVPVRGKPNVALLVGTATVAKSGKGYRRKTKGRQAQGRTYGDEVFFILIRSTTIPSRLHFEAIAQAVADKIPDLIEENAVGP
jgi:hypothetical protein